MWLSILVLQRATAFMVLIPDILPKKPTARFDLVEYFMRICKKATNERLHKGGEIGRLQSCWCFCFLPGWIHVVPIPPLYRTAVMGRRRRLSIIIFFFSDSWSIDLSADLEPIPKTADKYIA